MKKHSIVTSVILLAVVSVNLFSMEDQNLEDVLAASKVLSMLANVHYETSLDGETVLTKLSHSQIKLKIVPSYVMAFLL